MMQAEGESFEGKRVVISGSGNVAVYGIEKVHQLGGTVVACSDSSGYVVDEKGIDLELLKQVKEVERGRIADYADRLGTASHVDGGSIWDVPCDVAIPSATQNELDDDAARVLVGNNCRYVVEGANMPTTPAAVASFREAGIGFAPGKAANAGGVATSALEMQQNASRDRWTFEHSEAKLAEIMRGIHARCHETAEEYGSPGDLVLGANVAGFLEVAEAVHAHGLI
jgi:glutamate dehydrogenase (NADP+)